MRRLIEVSVLLFAAVVLLVPVSGMAGSATSRWDLTIGGYVKFDMGWGSQSQGQDAYLALRQGYGPYDNASDQNGSFFMYSGETRLNFLVKGPDAWGAKTSAFIEGHFRGDASTTPAQGTFALRHAFMQFDWPSTKLTIGQTWQRWAFLPTFPNIILEGAGLVPFNRGSRQPLARVEQTFAKNWTWSLAAVSPTNTLGNNANNTPTGVVDGFTLSQMPFFEGTFGWTSDKCGKIGPWQMLASLDGFYGQQKLLTTYTNGNNVVSGDKQVNAWGLAFKGLIPIVPERKGNKTGAFYVSGMVMYGQNMGWYLGSVATTTYNYAAPQQQALGWNTFHSPVTYGGWGQATYYITDQLFVNAWYGYLRNDVSHAYQAASAGTNQIQNTSQAILNFSYDVNQAIRFGLEGAYFNTRYAGYGASTMVAGIPATQKDGRYYEVRFGAFYFF